MIMLSEIEGMIERDALRIAAKRTIESELPFHVQGILLEEIQKRREIRKMVRKQERLNSKKEVEKIALENLAKLFK